MHMKNRFRVAILALGLAPLFGALGGSLSGCGSAVPVRRESAMPAATDGATGAGSTWSTVLASEHASETDLVWPGDGAYARRDAQLALRIDSPVDGVASSWPEPARMSLDDARRLYLNRRAESMLYFHDRHHGHGHTYRSRYR